MSQMEPSSPMMAPKSICPPPGNSFTMAPTQASHPLISGPRHVKARDVYIHDRYRCGCPWHQNPRSDAFCGPGWSRPALIPRRKRRTTRHPPGSPVSRGSHPPTPTPPLSLYTPDACDTPIRGDHDGRFLFQSALPHARSVWWGGGVLIMMASRFAFTRSVPVPCPVTAGPHRAAPFAPPSRPAPRARVPS